MKSGFETIESNELVTVAGGAAPTSNTSTGTSSSTNDQLLSTVQGIQSSLKDLSSNKNQGLFGGPNGGLTMAMFAMAMQRRNSTTVVNYGRGGYYWQSSW